MANVTEFLERVLSHDTLYDPVKAHEYYLKTRDLKGRRSAKDLGKSTTKKEGWAFVQDQVKEKQTAETKAAGEANKTAVDQLHEQAQAKREEISAKLQAIVERISNEATQTRDQIDSEVKSKIDALPPMPKGLNKEQAAKFAADRKEEIAKIRGEADSKRSDVTTFSKAWRKGSQKDASEERSKVVDELKSSLDGAKQTYQKVRDDIKAKYEAQLNQEFANIRDNA